MNSPAVWSSPRSMLRRRSPSVMTPTRWPSSSVTPDHAEPLGRHLDHRVVHRAVLRGSAAATCRHASAAAPAAAARRAIRRDEAGRNRSRVTPFCRMTVIASASPSASVIVVEVVGATDSGPTSAQCGRTSDAGRRFGEHRAGMAGDRDDRDVRALEMVDHRLELGGLAALRDQDRDVAAARPCRDRRGSLRRGEGTPPSCRSMRRSPRSCGRHGPICRDR